MRTALALSVVGAAFAVAAPACAQSQATASAAVTLVQPSNITRTQTLQFGKLKGGNNQQGPGTITVDTFGVRSSTGGAQPIADTPNDPHAAEFALTGVPGGAYHVNLPSGTVSVPEAGTGPALLASAFTARTLSLGPGVNGMLNPGGPTPGQDTVFVGATLAVPAGTNPGIYTLALTITATYD
jgi:Domain of unknown function (DUF4402)